VLEIPSYSGSIRETRIFDLTEPKRCKSEKRHEESGRRPYKGKSEGKHGRYCVDCLGVSRGLRLIRFDFSVAQGRG
jgi:hypothetical protein